MSRVERFNRVMKIKQEQKRSVQTVDVQDLFDRTDRLVLVIDKCHRNVRL